MSVCADANITGTFLHFWTHKIHYKLQQSTLQNFDDGGLWSGWSFVRTPKNHVNAKTIIYRTNSVLSRAKLEH